MSYIKQNIYSGIKVPEKLLNWIIVFGISILALLFFLGIRTNTTPEDEAKDNGTVVTAVTTVPRKQNNNVVLQQK